MITLANAKFLLFVALCFGPQFISGHKASVEISSKNEYCTWVKGEQGWALLQLNKITNHWPLNGTNVSEDDYARSGIVNAQTAQEIKHHNWNQNSPLYFPNGDSIERQGNTVYYTVNPGGANEQVFTIQPLSDDKPITE
jgi:hypothetical protein